MTQLCRMSKIECGKGVGCDERGRQGKRCPSAFRCGEKKKTNLAPSHLPLRTTIAMAAAGQSSVRGGLLALLVVLYTCTIFMAGRFSVHGGADQLRACEVQQLGQRAALGPSGDPGAEPGTGASMLLEACQAQLAAARRQQRAAPATDGGQASQPCSTVEAQVASLQVEVAQLKAKAQRQSDCVALTSAAAQRSGARDGDGGPDGGAAGPLSGSSFNGWAAVDRSKLIDLFLDFHVELPTGTGNTAYLLYQGGWRSSFEADDDGHVSLTAALRGCQEVDIVISNPTSNRCVAVLEGKNTHNYYVTRFIANGTAKAPTNWRFVPALYRGEGTYQGAYGRFPGKDNQDMHDSMMATFFSAWPDIQVRPTSTESLLVLCLCILCVFARGWVHFG